MTKSETPQLLNIDDATRQLYARAELLWGAIAQYDMLIEECGELVKIMCHYKRKRVPVKAIVDEMVDVQIMIEQVLLLLKPMSESNLEDYFIKRREISLMRVGLKLSESKEIGIK